MAKRDDVSSTEQLLELIRNDETPADDGSGDVQPSPEKALKSASRKLGRSKKGLVIGVDFGEEALKFVKVRRHSVRQWDLLAHKIIPYTSEIRPGNQEFDRFLKENLRKTLKELSGFAGRCELWAILSSPQADTRLFRIPKTPRKQIANAAYWTFKKEVPETNQDQDVFDFEILGEIHEAGTTVSNVFGYRVPKSEVDKLNDLFSDIGCPLTGICLAPFAIQNLFRTQVAPAKEKIVATLLVDDNWAFVEVFSSRNLVLSRAIKTGRNRFLEDILESVRETIALELPSEDGEPQESPINLDFAGDLLRTLNTRDRNGEGIPEGMEIDKDDIFQMILPSLNRLTRKVDTGLDYYANMVGNEDVNRVFVGGDIAFSERILGVIEDGIQRPCETLDPFSPENNRLKTLRAPVPDIDRGNYLKALGAALSHTSWTPNLLLTYGQREMERSRRRGGMAVLGSFFVAILICLGIFLWQGQGIAENKKEIFSLGQELAQCRQLVDKKRMLALAFEIRDKRKLEKHYSEKYKGMAVIGELSRITPFNIRLLDVAVQMGKPKIAEEKGAPLKMVLEGLVLGERQHLESYLTAYLVKLEGQPIFKHPMIKKSQVEPHEGREALRFTAEMEIL